MKKSYFYTIINIIALLILNVLEATVVLAATNTDSFQIHKVILISIKADATNLAATARSIAIGNELRIAGLKLDQAVTDDLVLKRFATNMPQAIVVLND